MSKLSRLFAGASAGLAVVVTGCGGSGDKTETVTTPAATTAAPPTTTAAQTTAPAPTTTAAAAGGDPLANVSPPPGSKKVDSGKTGGTAWARYSTSTSPKGVVAAYASEFKTDGWKVVQAGGTGGGWGPYGGSGSGLTAKKARDYADVQAGAARGGKTWFEICAGPGSRTACDRISTKAEASTSGSHPGGVDPNTSSGPS